MSIETAQDTPQRHWLVEHDPDTGRQIVSVAARIEFAYDGNGTLVGPRRIIVAGGRVAVEGVITLDQLLDRTTYTYEEVVPDNEVHQTFAIPGARTGAVLPTTPATQAIPGV